MSPSISVVKTLFALSGNTCGYDGCETKLTDPAWKQVTADVAHICGDQPGALRCDPSMTTPSATTSRISSCCVLATVAW